MAIGRQPIPICQAAGDSGGIASGKCSSSARCRARSRPRPPAPQEARQLFQAGLEAVAADEEASPANATTSEITRSRTGRSPSTGQASIEAQIGMVKAISAASLAGSHSSASPISAIHSATLSSAASTSRGHSARGTCRLWPRASASAASARRRSRRRCRAWSAAATSLSRYLRDGPVETPAHRGDGEEHQPGRRDGAHARRVGFKSVMG